MSRTIPRDQIRLHHGSFADPNGQLFFWQDGLYRALGPAYTDVAERLYANGLMDRLVAQGLVVESEPTDLRLEGAARVVRHRQLPFITYPCEWSPSMFKSAALHLIDLEIALARQGLTVSDPHAWNLLFDWGRPKFVDIGAFGFARDSARHGPSTWPGFHSFCQYLLFPLMAAEGRLERFSRLSFFDLKGLSAEELGHMLGPAAGSRSSARARFARQFGHVPAGAPRRTATAVRGVLAAIRRRLPGELGRLARAGREEFLQLLRRYVEDIRPDVARGQWSGYNEPAPGTQPDPAWYDNSKIDNMRAILERLRPASVLDVGANTGYYSRMALSSGAAVVAIDGEVSCVDALHASARDENLRLVPAVIDVKNPTPGLGPVGAELPSCFERLRCDLVMALAVTHHLAYRSQMTFEQMAQSFSAWSKRYLLVEYVSPDDEHTTNWNLQAKGWYGFQQFCDAVSRHFAITEVMESHPASRRLVVAEKRA